MSDITATVVLLLCAIPASVAQQEVPKVTIARWPQDKVAAVSLTFDDAMNSQLDNAAPILAQHHLRGTFFVMTGSQPWQKRKQEWIRLAKAGNELGNHTLHHPCLLPEITPHSQDYTPEMMKAEIRDAAQEITTSLSANRGLTFAYPCGNMSFGPAQDQVRNAALYLQYVSEYAFAARGAGGGGSQNPDELSVLTVADLGPTAGQDFPQLVALLEPAISERNWGVYCFHGVGGEWLSITSDTLAKLATYLEQHPEVWTATFGDVVRYIQERNASSVCAQKTSAGEIVVKLIWPMDARIYDMPLTLRLELPRSWREASATVGRKKLTSRLISDGRQQVVLVDVPAGTEAVRLRETP